MDGLAWAVRAPGRSVRRMRADNFLLAPEAKPRGGVGPDSAIIGLKAIWSDARFWRLAPLSTTCVGTAWVLQGLWAAPWLADIEGLERPAISNTCSSWR